MSPAATIRHDAILTLPVWQLINRRQQPDPQAMRTCCTVLLVAYAVVVVVLFEPDRWDFTALRAGGCVLGAVGLTLVRALTFDQVRTFTLAVGLYLPLSAAYIDGMKGNDLPEVALTALATCAALPFLQLGRDFLMVNGLLVLGHALILSIAPPPIAPLPTIVIILGGTMAAASAAGLNTLIYRARWSHGVEQLERALAARSEFLNTMSHELRSPLHVIIGYADLMEDGAEDLSPAFLRERIRGSALELLRIVEDTLNAASLEARRVPLRLEEFAMRDVVAELTDGVRALPEAGHGVPVHWNLEPDLPAVYLDRLKVKEIVQNLVSNALKFTTAGEVQVTIARAGEPMRIDVRDSGEGIPPDALTRIFDLFERVEQGGPQRPAGVGLGLYIVKTLVGMMQGTIEVQSTPGSGSCFTVHLPLTLGVPQASTLAPVVAAVA